MAETLNNVLKIIRYDSNNENVEALKGKYGQVLTKDLVVTVVKNVMTLYLHNGADIDIKLPDVYDGFLRTNKNRTIKVQESKITATLASDENAVGILILKKWN